MKRKIMNALLDWKSKSVRKPLIVHGARQVGKTYILKEFAKENFENFVYINFESNLLACSYFEGELEPERIIQYLEADSGQRIEKTKTLILFDEIQTCERALTSLKYFNELAPEYAIVAAGSLLGVAIHRGKFSFPVGKVEVLTLHPLDFEEFLWAMDQDTLSKEIRNCYEKNSEMPEGLHVKSLELYRKYLIVGGMPECVRRYVETGTLLESTSIQNSILDQYIADMAKYSSNVESVKIRACFQSIPAQLAKENKKFQYKVVKKGGTASLFGESIEWLRLSGIVTKVYKINHAYDPISTYVDLSSYKLYMGDTGLLVAKTGISQQTVLTESDNIFMGAITENYVAQQLFAKGYELFYWESESIAEVDFVVQRQEMIMAIEAKRSDHVKSRSLTLFGEKYAPKLKLRFSSRNFGVSDQLVSIPLYAVYCLPAFSESLGESN